MDQISDDVDEIVVSDMIDNLLRFLFHPDIVRYFRSLIIAMDRAQMLVTIPFVTKNFGAHWAAGLDFVQARMKFSVMRSSIPTGGKLFGTNQAFLFAVLQRQKPLVKLRTTSTIVQF